MIAACLAAPRSRHSASPTVAMPRANLREGVIWARPDTDEARETTQDMAGRLSAQWPAPVNIRNKPKMLGEQALNKTILVVGGGVTGMTAAPGDRGCRLVTHHEERGEDGALGGWAAKWHKTHPGRGGS